MLLVGTLVLWTSLVAGQSRLHLSLPKENSPLYVNAEVINKGSSDAKAIYQDKFLYEVHRGVISFKTCLSLL